jgi:hypothetical protein
LVGLGGIELGSSEQCRHGEAFAGKGGSVVGAAIDDADHVVDDRSETA